MRLKQLVSAPNRRYAIGEIVLIVVGVTIALAATAWYDGRQERRDEVLILRQLRQTLIDDLQEINATWEITQQRERNLMALLDQLESDRPYTADLGLKFQSLLGWRIVRLSTAPFETLKAGSYRVISNPILRGMLISFFEDSFPRLERNLDLDRDFAIEKVQSYYFANFVMTVSEENDVAGGMQAWLPQDYERIKAESYVANVSRYRADLLRRLVLRQYEETTRLVNEILKELDKELADVATARNGG